VVEVGEPKRIVDLYAEILSLGEIQSKKTVISENDAGHGKYPLATSGVQSAMALGSKPRDEAVQAFVSGQSADDRCDQNPSYNKYEHRFGNGRAQIADYLLINENQVNPTAIFCETVLDVYIKVHFKADIDNPLIGVAFINQMGVMVYGTHSGWLGVSMPAAKEGDVQVYRYSVRIDLRSGPWFIELAVAATQADLCDKRSNLAQIIVMAKRHFDGLTSLATRCEFLK
jgi:lipopolysaccharide transport system ATP-binding protein